MGTAQGQPRQHPYHDTRVGPVVVGGVHALEPLLPRRVPEVCETQNTSQNDTTFQVLFSSQLKATTQSRVHLLSVTS